MQKGFPFPSIVVSLVAAIVFLTGCGSRDENATKFVEGLVPVTGVVTQEGQPVPGVQVIYFVDPSTGTAGPRAWGVTDENGKYSLVTYVPGSGNDSADGALPGDYRVMIQKLVMPDGGPVPEETTDADAEALGARQMLLPKYSSPTASQLKATVNAESTVNDFVLAK